METMCTIVFHWFSCVSMRDEIRFFMCLISLVVAVPVNHFSAEPRKGRRLHFFLPDGGMGFPSNDGCVWSVLLANENTGLYAINRLCKLSNSIWSGCKVQWYHPGGSEFGDHFTNNVFLSIEHVHRLV